MERNPQRTRCLRNESRSRLSTTLTRPHAAVVDPVRPGSLLPFLLYLLRLGALLYRAHHVRSSPSLDASRCHGRRRCGSSSHCSMGQHHRPHLRRNPARQQHHAAQPDPWCCTYGLVHGSFPRRGAVPGRCPAWLDHYQTARRGTPDGLADERADCFRVRA